MSTKSTTKKCCFDKNTNQRFLEYLWLHLKITKLIQRKIVIHNIYKQKHV